MKKRFIGVFAALALALGLAFGLSACGSDKKAEYVGDWEIVGLVQSGQPTSEDDIALMKSFGLTVTLTLNEDGTGSLNLFGTVNDITWDVSGDSATLEMNGSTAELTLEDGTLRMVQGEDAITFARVES